MENSSQKDQRNIKKSAPPATKVTPELSVTPSSQVKIIENADMKKKGVIIEQNETIMECDIEDIL